MYEIPKGYSSSLFVQSREQAIAILNQEGRKLEGIVWKLWQKYYQSYYPSMYPRTRKTPYGFKLLTVERDGVIGYRIVLTFEDDAMYHKQYLGLSQPKGHAVMLISNGWNAKKLERRFGRRIDRFTYYEGFNLLGKVMEEYGRQKSKFVSMEISWTGKDDYTK